MEVSDPFEKMRRLSQARRDTDLAWEAEVRELRAAGFSLRTIAQVAGVSHDTIWKVR
jgi:lambda repressor-like predicted transcriptional regulator